MTGSGEARNGAVIIPRVHLSRRAIQIWRVANSGVRGLVSGRVPLFYALSARKTVIDLFSFTHETKHMRVSASPRAPKPIISAFMRSRFLCLESFSLSCVFVCESICFCICFCIRVYENRWWMPQGALLSKYCILNASVVFSRRLFVLGYFFIYLCFSFYMFIFVSLSSYALQMFFIA